MRDDPRWNNLPYEYALLSIALCLTFPQALDGFKRHLSPEEVMFEVEGFTPEQIEEWNKY